MKSAYVSPDIMVNKRECQRHRKNQQSIETLLDLLRNFIDGKHTTDGFADYLGSQRALCRYANSELDIRPMSLNTMKAAAESHKEQGYKQIDDLRKQALSVKIQGFASPIPPPPPTRSSKASFLAQIRTLRQENSLMRQDLVIVVAQANRAMRRMVAYGTLAGKEDLARKEFMEIVACLNLATTGKGLETK